jgi:hypothetical protein
MNHVLGTIFLKYIFCKEFVLPLDVSRNQSRFGTSYTLNECRFSLRNVGSKDKKPFSEIKTHASLDKTNMVARTDSYPVTKKSRTSNSKLSKGDRVFVSSFLDIKFDTQVDYLTQEKDYASNLKTFLTSSSSVQCFKSEFRDSILTGCNMNWAKYPELKSHGSQQKTRLIRLCKDFGEYCTEHKDPTLLLYFDFYCIKHLLDHYQFYVGGLAESSQKPFKYDGTKYKKLSGLIYDFFQNHINSEPSLMQDAWKVSWEESEMFEFLKFSIANCNFLRLIELRSSVELNMDDSMDLCLIRLDGESLKVHDMNQMKHKIKVQYDTIATEYPGFTPAKVYATYLGTTISSTFISNSEFVELKRDVENFISASGNGEWGISLRFFLDKIGSFVEPLEHDHPFRIIGA